MIQRIQTVYLVLGALVLLSFFLFDPIRQGSVAVNQAWFAPVVLTVSGLAAVVALGGVFLYKDRKRQRTAVMAAQGLTVVVMLALYGGLYVAGSLSVRTAEGIDVGMLMLLLAPVAAYLLFRMARRGVEKDIELVRSMDRLR